MTLIALMPSLRPWKCESKTGRTFRKELPQLEILLSQLETSRWLLFFGQRQLCPNVTVTSHDAGQGVSPLGGDTALDD